MQLEGIHHITAITGDAPRQRRLLHARARPAAGRQDRQPGRSRASTTSSTPTSRGRPGSELTFFEYPGAIPGRAGAGMVHRIVSRVGSPRGARLLGASGWAPRASRPSAPRAALRFADPEGLGHELVVDRAATSRWSRRAPGDPGRARAAGLRRRARLQRPTRAHRGRCSSACSARRRPGDATWELRGERRGGTIAYDPPPAEPGRQSAGTRAPRRLGHDRRRAPALARAPARRPACRRRRSSTATTSTRSTSASPAACCSRSPTTAPASPSTGRVEELGSKIILPPFLESRRAEIEARLTPLPDPRARSAS